MSEVPSVSKGPRWWTKAISWLSENAPTHHPKVAPPSSGADAKAASLQDTSFSRSAPEDLARNMERLIELTQKLLDANKRDRGF